MTGQLGSAPSSIAPTPDAWLRHGQSLETAGQPADAVAAYDHAFELFHAASPVLDLSARRFLGLLWMNRGNALQKIPAADSLPAAVHSYDEAIARFETLPFATEPVFLNHLGAAWLNRGHALIAAQDLPAALTSFDRAIQYLEQLPLDANPFYRLNLAGAWVNRAHLQLSSSPALTRKSAFHALSLVSTVEHQTPAFAEMSLRARRTLVTALGQMLVAAEIAREPIAALASEASDAIDDGLVLARSWEARGFIALRPLALRLFRLGAHLYRMHQPHFLAEFLLENIETGTAFSGLPEFHQVADDALSAAIAELSRPRHLVVGAPDSEKLFATLRSLRDARTRLSLPSVTSAPPLVPSV